MKILRNQLIKAALGLCMLAANMAHANISTIRGSATPQMLSASANNVVHLRWQVGTVAGYSGGVTSSASANVFDPATSTNLLSVGSTTFSQAGGGPMAFSESINISAAQVKTWLDAGVTAVVINRVFLGGNRVAGEISLRLSASSLSGLRNTAAELDIQRLQILLDEQQRKDESSAAKVVAVDAALQAQLKVNYAGSGLLEGKWQVAEPGSTEGKPLYRTLAIVRQPLLKSQESQVQGPVLPTHRIGKYLLRFCVSETDQATVLAGGDSACPNPQLTVQAAYQVLERSGQVGEINIRSPQQQAVNKEAPFVWQAVAGAALYKLDIFELQGDQQWFITGALLPSASTQTTLTQLMQQKLTAGATYRWQVSAVNADGKLLARSQQAIFTYQP